MVKWKNIGSPCLRIFLRHFVFIIVSALFLLLLGFEAAVAVSEPDVGKLPPLRDGDLVFQTTLDFQSMATMLASNTLYTHVGMIKTRNHGLPVVVEVGPVRETPLQQFIDRGVGQRLTIARIKDVSPGQVSKALAWAKRQYGKPYDLFFMPDTKSFYCSELVADSFKEGAGITLGKYQKVGALTHSAAMDKVIEERWPLYPLCKGDKTMTYDKCYKIIMQQELITPASIADDPRVVPIWSNYP